MRFRTSQWASGEHDVRLSQIEARTGALVGLFQSNKEIAHILHAGGATVGQHVSDMLRGLRLGNRGQLAQWVYQHPEALVGQQPDDPLIAALRIDYIRVLRLVELPPGAIASRTSIPLETVQRYLSELPHLLRVPSRELADWARANPEALLQGWAHTDIHPPGCNCGATFCALFTDLRSIAG